ncbi:carbonate dehydratase [Salinispirillum sp. LH 10-3-1]|uniref:Carbonic anhydrase n=2 Tax=Salinispirillum sp. LH 10-3-1 TaxID=2952525 RepID=A0AB38YG58_9GAMM
MDNLNHLLLANQTWAASKLEGDPEYFSRLAAQQKPEILWIGCSDSRVPANEIVNLPPGEIFVQRNIANQVMHTDINCLSVVQYAIDILQVKHVIVAGHYGCGGVQAALTNEEYGIVDNWLRSIKDLYARHEPDLKGLPEQKLLDRMCELNVAEQVNNLAKTKAVQRAWAREQELHLHGWIYAIQDGILQDLDVTQSGAAALPAIYHMNTPDNPMKTGG